MCYTLVSFHRSRKKASLLGSVVVEVRELDGLIAVNNLILDHSFTLLLHPATSFSTPVLWGKATCGIWWPDGQCWWLCALYWQHWILGTFFYNSDFTISSCIYYLQVGVFLSCFQSDESCYCMYDIWIHSWLAQHHSWTNLTPLSWHSQIYFESFRMSKSFVQFLSSISAAQHAYLKRRQLKQTGAAQCNSKHFVMIGLYGGKEQGSLTRRTVS